MLPPMSCGRTCQVSLEEFMQAMLRVDAQTLAALVFDGRSFTKVPFVQQP